ncbi:MAG: dihydrofolate reductase [bacterium]|jgi:dihydrofolate reductase
MEKQISIIVAIAANRAIGKDNQLLWHISEDLKRFKRITEGHYVVMGKKTFYSLPKRPLPKRKNMVITDIPGEQIEGCEMAYSIEDAISKMDPEKENFIIGGGSVYAQFLSHASKMYITRVDKDFEADVFFPKFDHGDWELAKKEEVEDDPQNDFTYAFETYVRKKVQ